MYIYIYIHIYIKYVSKLHMSPTPLQDHWTLQSEGFFLTCVADFWILKIGVRIRTLSSIIIEVENGCILIGNYILHPRNLTVQASFLKGRNIFHFHFLGRPRPPHYHDDPSQSDKEDMSCRVCCLMRL